METPPGLPTMSRGRLEGLLGVVRELGATTDIGDTLDRIARAVVDILGFEAVAINVTMSDGSVQVAAVAGTPEVAELLGRSSPLHAWQDLLAECEPWGSLRFHSHTHDQAVIDKVVNWTPPIGPAEPAGEWHPLDSLLAPMLAPDGSLLGVLSVDQPRSRRVPDAEQRTFLELLAAQAAIAITDFRAREVSEQGRRDAERRWRMAFENSPVGAAIIKPDGSLSQPNDALARMLGYSRDQLVQLPFSQYTHPDDVESDAAQFQQILDGSRDSYETTKRFLHSDGHTVFGQLHIGVIRDDQGRLQSIVGQVNDTTQRMAAQRELAYRVSHDALTDLPNRSLLEDQLGSLLARGQQVTVLCCDVDRFKTVNDSLGHDAGDELLVAIAGRLQAALPPGFMLGRVGGNEFVAIAGQDPELQSLSALGQRVVAAFDDPLLVQGHWHTASISVGVTLGGSVHHRPDEVLREAALALARAKRHGPGRVEIYDPAQDKPATLADLQLEYALRGAIAEQTALIPYFQPIVGLSDDRPVGYEALVRWRHPTLGLLDPAEFLPLAERTGLIVPLGWWMLEVSGRAATNVRLTGGWSRWIAVNASGSQLGRGRLVPALRQALEINGLSPGRLHLEITETALVEASPAAIKEVREVADLGVRIALDDFGTGYSSLSLLRDLPVSTVKIDRSFVSPIASDPSARAIVRSVIALCQELSITTVAEGIETEEQLTSLRALGCSQGQGYLIGRPAPLPEAAG